ncbi:ATPase [Streptomyces sp. WAC05374]|uniref:sensor histidine kinase n=1 Tax=Streptomyces sp. WAC05374 TaxID=2487420 RepID=UPI0010564651|nr:nitrate- and nitrite sensing domain-containing protein [Streptomyces sp. WAC05374]TDF47888.1 ATPase [Streptomyces sp. WAC05374]TDF53961.1 ATPase [Streptomyces sp. WAC05374]
MPTRRTPHGPAARPGRRAHAGPPATTPAERAPRRIRRRPRLRPGALRPRTVRARIIALLMVPVVSLLALWGFATVTTAQDVAQLRELHRVDARVREPVAATVAALQAERRAAVRRIAAPGSLAAATAAELQQHVRRTDAAVARLRLDNGHTVADGGGIPTEVSARIRHFTGHVERLTALRAAVLDRTAPWDTVYDAYTTTITAGFDVGGALTGTGGTPNGSHARVLLELSRAGEMLAREDALLTSAHLTGHFTAPRLRQFTGAAETRRTLLRSATADLARPERDTWRTLSTRGPYRQVTAAEDRITAAPAGRRAAAAVPATTWDRDHAAVRDALAALEDGARRSAVDRADPLAGGVLTPAGAAVVLGLAAVAASLVISVRIGRALVVELVTLRNTALEIARRELPDAMRRLRAGEDLDVPAEAPPGRPAQDEIGHVGEALGTVHRAALRAAAERAELSRGISGVFVNLARRSQVLVHRQLNLLDRMERRVDDPAELGDLFRLDHLTTRMRRHAESLIILSGAAPGRAWRTPVPLTNVVRAAVSEIEDYARVEVRHLPETAVVGAAVADLTHLLAELVENATQFSPPHTKVRVTGEPVGNGYALEIEDRGLGMGKDALDRANRRIEHSEALDLFDSDRLGLFVVSRLSARHAIKVHLRTSPYGGTTAVVLLPTALLHSSLPLGRAETPTPPPSAPAPQADHSRAPHAPVPAHAPGPTARPTHPADPPPAAVTTHGEPPPAPVTALRPPPAAAAPQPPAGAPPGDGHGGLPRRVRQASLAPQLREAPPDRQNPGPGTHADAHPGTHPPGDGSADDPAGRDPERVRARMTAYRDGWARGAAPGTGPAPGPRPRNRTGAGTTPGIRTGEGDEG